MAGTADAETRKIRIHDTEDVVLHLYTTSAPVIERSRSLAIGPLPESEAEALPASIEHAVRLRPLQAPPRLLRCRGTVVATPGLARL